MILTLKELAKLLRVNERTILRMQETGQIKGVKIGGQWRFNGSEIDQLFFPDKATTGEATVPVAEFGRSHLSVPISRVLTPERMVLELKASDRDAAIHELCDRIRKQGLLLNVKELEERVIAREELLSTGVGNHIAIPHPRDPVSNLTEMGALVFGRSKVGVDFNAVDGKPVHLVFLLCCQNIEMHLHMMGKLARLLHQEAVVERLMASKTPEDVQRLLLEVERADFLG
jgi:excisionase family DNA binding protein